MEADCTSNDLPVNGVTAPLPAGTRLLHIGPHTHGVVFPAHSRHPMEAALAACARPAMIGDTAPTEKYWTRLLEQVEATGGKTSVISSEFFADAEGDDTIARIVEQLGGERVHVLVTLHPLVKIVGAERITVVVVDDRDRDGLMRTFEQLLGLPGNLLQPVPDATNRSLTLAETEMLRNLNKEFRGNGLRDELYSKLVRNGAVMHMKNACSQSPEDVKILTPEWAVEAAAEIGAGMVRRIGDLGVRVIGDPGLLSAVPKAPARALYGALAAAAESPVRHTSPAKARTVHQTSSKELMRVLGHRCLKKLRRR
ncbi:hypothetical protein OHQ89_33835 [Streptomyces canus]|uniref:hypothetical protein n=1 Tax=Streptomyces canus TaxID=58343 RepID=UPI0030DFFDBE